MSSNDIDYWGMRVRTSSDGDLFFEYVDEEEMHSAASKVVCAMKENEIVTLKNTHVRRGCDIRRSPEVTLRGSHITSVTTFLGTEICT